MKRFFYDKRKGEKLCVDILVYTDGEACISTLLTSLDTGEKLASCGNANLSGTLSLLKSFAFIPEVRGVVTVLEKYERVWRKSACSHFLDSHPDVLDVGKWYRYRKRDIDHSKYWAVLRMAKGMAEKGITEYSLSNAEDILLFSVTEGELENRESIFYSQEDFSKKSDLVNLLYEVYEEIWPNSKIPVDFGGYDGVICPVCGHTMGETFKIRDKSDINTLIAFKEGRKSKWKNY